MEQSKGLNDVKSRAEDKGKGKGKGKTTHTDTQRKANCYIQKNNNYKKRRKHYEINFKKNSIKPLKPVISLLKRPGASNLKKNIENYDTYTTPYLLTTIVHFAWSESGTMLLLTKQC